MERTNNNSIRRFIPFGIAMLGALLVVGGGFFYVYKTSSSKQPESQSAVPMPAQSQSELTSVSSPESAPAQSAPDLTGKWTGKYKVTSPKGCAGFSGSWTAKLTQSGSSFSGSYKSDVLVNGVVSGTSSGTKGFSWKVTGGGGAQLKGSVTGPNSIAGSFTGPTCPGTSQRTAGTFSGGR